MRRFTCLMIGFIILTLCCNGQTTPDKEVYNSIFKWNITIPENFENISASEWDRLQKKGKSAMEKTYGGKIVNQTKTIFAFKNSQSNYFESNYQIFDTAGKESYPESCIKADNIIYNTFKSQMSDAMLDTTRTIESVGGLAFQKFTVEITYVNKVLLHLLFYNRLFGNKELTVSMVYTDEYMGRKILASWRNSKFGK